MRRIVILGNAGTGKSTLARRLGRQLGLPVVLLDALNWDPGWKVVSAETFRERLRAAIAGDAWITDGNYAVLSFDLRLPRADLLIWVESPRLLCMARVIGRAVKSHLRPDEHLAAGCPERFDRRFLGRLRFIWNFDRVNRPHIEALRRQFGLHVPVLVLKAGRRSREWPTAAPSVSGTRAARPGRR